MRPFRVLCFGLALTATVTLRLRADDGVVPKGPPPTRYDAMASRSPFTAPTAAAPVATPSPVAGPHWWDQMFLTSLMDRGGVYYVGLVDKASNKHYLLATGRADEESQLLLRSVQWNDHLDQTTAMVSKGAETAPPIRFDASGAAAPSAPAQPAMSAPRPLSGVQTPALPPGFSNVPPPPPSVSTPVLRRPNPIAARPVATPQNPPRGAATPPANGPRRIVVPSGEDN